jgi:hypothetical protein
LASNPTSWRTGMIAAGILASKEDPTTSRFRRRDRQKSLSPRSSNTRARRNAEASIPLRSKNWRVRLGLRGLIEVTNLLPRAGSRPSRGRLSERSRHLARYNTEPLLPRQAQEHLHQSCVSRLHRSSPAA